MDPLLTNYLLSRSHEDFARLLDRHLALVYSAALRQTHDAQLAHDVTQAVFIILFKKADRVPAKTPLAAWLIKTTRYTALNALRKRQVQRHHEQKAARMNSSLTSNQPEETWQTLAPLLDEGIVGLGARYRDAVLLAFFEKMTMREIGHELGITESAAGKRVSRAVEKLRSFFQHRGISAPADVISTGLLSHAISAAPPAITKVSISSAIAATTPGISSLVKSALITMAIEKIKAAALISTLFVTGLAAAGTVIRIVDAPPMSLAPTPAPATSQSAALQAPAAPLAPAPAQPTTAPQSHIVFPSGPTVDLLGICNEPLDQDGWWAADGSAIPAPKVPTMRFQMPGQNLKNIRFTFRQSAALAPDSFLTIACKTPRPMGSGIAFNGKEYVYVLSVPKGTVPKTADLTLEYAHGPWTEKTWAIDEAPPAELPLKIAGVTSIGDKTQIQYTFTDPIPSPDNTVLRDRIAVESEGKQIFPDRTSVNNHEMTLRFPCPKDKIQFIVYASRLAETVELKHIAASPAPAADQGL